MSRILITGALGQLGVSLTKQLRQRSFVLATDIRSVDMPEYQTLNVLDKTALEQTIRKHKIDCVVHLAALLSYKAELDVQTALNLNLKGVHNILDLAHSNKLQVFCPSTIGVYGFESNSPLRHQVQDDCPQHPRTIYGITKTHLELMGNYYFRRFGVDFRSTRLPGILSKPTGSIGQLGGGTTDYAVDMMVCKSSTFESPIPKDAEMPFLWIDDCLNGIDQMLQMDSSRLGQDRTYNISGLSFTPSQLAKKLKLEVSYTQTDPVRTSIAWSWPRSLDYSRATKDFGFNPKVTTLPQLLEAFNSAK